MFLLAHIPELSVAEDKQKNWFSKALLIYLLTFPNIDGFRDVPPLPTGGAGAVHQSHVLERLQKKKINTPSYPSFGISASAAEHCEHYKAYLVPCL